MTIQEVETELKKLNPDLSVRANDKSDLAGVYWKEVYTSIAMPKEDVPVERNDALVDQYGYPHRSYKQVVERVNAFLEDIKLPEYVAYITEEFDDEERPVGSSEDVAPAEMLVADIDGDAVDNPSV